MKKGLAFTRQEQLIRNLTTANSATRREFESRFGTRAVVILSHDDVEEDIAGFVVGFHRDLMLKVWDDDGETHFVHLDRVVEDRGRTWKGEMLSAE